VKQGHSADLMQGAANPLAGYAPAMPAADLYAGASPDVAAKWTRLAAGLARLGGTDGERLHEQVGREIQELGLTFRLTGDEDERAWPLNPMPLLIGAREWRGIERGLIQRADLMERIAADIYGPQSLVADGSLPAAVVSGSRHFVRKMKGTVPPGNHFIHVYAVDLARGPRGQWRVLADRLRMANGVGYALENRLALSRSTGSLLSQVNTRRLAGFYRSLRQGFAADCQRDSPRIALLSPGRFNQSYPEQAHLARYLGLPLVEGRDLTVSNDLLYVRTIAGPKRIDGLWRWIDTLNIDPLSFDSHSQIGVPDLFEAWSKGGLMVANWPGVGVMESRAFSAFVPRLASKLLAEPLLLPNVATWWCGQEGEAAAVRARLDDLMICTSFGGEVEGLPEGRTLAGSSLSADQRAELFAAMERRPMDYCGQEVVQRSTSPCLIGGQYEARTFSLRAFVARGADGEWVVMPGGFARLSSSADLRTPLMGQGDISADVCIVDDQPVQPVSLLGMGAAPVIQRGGGILSSQAADNLFWFSRYAERAEMTVRVIKSLLGSSIDADGGAARDTATLGRLVQLLVQWGAISAEQAKLPLGEVCQIAFSDEACSGSVARLVAALRRIGGNLRDRIATDFWRLARQPLPRFDPAQTESMLNSLSRMIERYSAMAGQSAENMVRGPAWHFHEIGRRVERATNVCRIARQLAGDDCDSDDLGLLLDLCDSQIIYRARYLVGPVRAAVLDLVLIDPNNPRSLLFQVLDVEKHLDALPTLQENAVPERPLMVIRALVAQLRAMELEGVSAERLKDIEVRLLGLSDAISQRYFLQYEKAEDAGSGSFLA